MDSYDLNKLTRLKALKQFGEKIQSIYATLEELEELDSKVGELEGSLGDENVIESIKVNGVKQDISNKEVSITVITSGEVDTAIQTAIAQAGHASFETATKIPSAEDAVENKLYLVKNEETSCYDIYAKVGDEVVRLDDTTVDLTNYVEKKEGHDLYPDADKTKLANIEPEANKYEHPTSDAGAQTAGLYKVTTDDNGHIQAVEAVVKDDITKLGIPGSDTTYEIATSDANGLMSAGDKEKLDGMDIASDDEVQDMLDELFA